MLLFIKLNKDVDAMDLRDKITDLKRYISSFKRVELLDVYTSGYEKTAVYECICGNVAIATITKCINRELKEFCKNVSSDYVTCIELDNLHAEYVFNGLRKITEKQAYTGVNSMVIYPEIKKDARLTITLITKNVSKSFYENKDDYLFAPIKSMTGVIDVKAV